MKFGDFHSNLKNLVVGVDTPIPLSNGKYVTAINFDNAATTPPFTSVLQEVFYFSPWYSSIHRGTGYKSKLSSYLYEKTRETVGDFVHADLETHTVIFVKNTTEAINQLAYRLCEKTKDCVVLSTYMEHHSNDLPWRKNFTVDYIDIDETGKLSLESLEKKIKQYQGRVKLVTIAGASNVTGHINPIYRIATIAHQYGAKILVDGAQYIPHVPMDMKTTKDPSHIDFLVFSGHKMYAPFGVGVLIGPKDVFKNGWPAHAGGGTVKIVTPDFIQWDEPPHKEEAGSPNIMGVVALQSAIRTLQQIGMDIIDRYEKSLTHYALHKLKSVPDIELYGNTENTVDRVGIITFNIKGIPHEAVATLLSEEAGIAVRNGCFCAQPYIQKLLKLTSEEIQSHIHDPESPHPGMVRLSFGLYNQYHEIDTLIDILTKIAKNKSAYLQKYHSLL